MRPIIRKEKLGGIGIQRRQEKPTLGTGKHIIEKDSITMRDIEKHTV